MARKTNSHRRVITDAENRLIKLKSAPYRKRVKRAVQDLKILASISKFARASLKTRRDVRASAHWLADVVTFDQDRRSHGDNKNLDLAPTDSLKY